MIRAALAAAAIVGLAAPVLADDVPPDLAEGRLRVCLLAGASATGQTELQAAVIQVRAFCGAQINRVRAQRTAGLSGDAKVVAIRKLDTEIAQAVANFSGLTP